MYKEEMGTLYFKDDFRISINTDNDSLFIMADYSSRSWQMNMEFQHYHNFYEIFIPLEPGILHLLDGKCFTLEQYDIVLIRPGLRHMTIYPKDKAMTKRLILDFRLDNELPGLEYHMEKALALFDKEVPVYRFKGEDLNVILKLLNNLFITGTEKPNGWKVLFYAEFLSFLWSLQRYPDFYANEDVLRSIEQKIYLVNGYITENFREDLSLEAVSRLFAISPSYLSHQFKRINGTTLVSYLHTIRVRSAAFALYYSKDPVKKVMKDSGFDSISQFNRVFRQLTGLSPTAFRESSNDKKNAILQSLDPESKEREPAAVLPREKREKRGIDKHLRLGINADCLGKTSPESIKAFLADNNLDTVQVSLSSTFPGSTSYSMVLEDSIERIRRQGFDISLLYCDIALSSPDDSEWERGLSEFSSALSIASRLGAKAVGTGTGPCLDDNRAKQFARIVEALERLLPFAARYGTAIALRPAFTDTINTPEQMKRLLDLFHVDYLKVIFDPVALLGPGLENNRMSFFESALTMYEGHVSAMLAKDTLGKGSQMLGTGIMAKVYPRLSLFLPYGTAVLLGNPDRPCLKEEVEYLRKSFS